MGGQVLCPFQFQQLVDSLAIDQRALVDGDADRAALGRAFLVHVPDAANALDLLADNISWIFKLKYEATRFCIDSIFIDLLL